VQKGYGQYCPIAKGAEIFAERWTPLIIRNVHVGAHSFSEIASGCPRISTAPLTSRLRSLERAGVIERRRDPATRGSLYYLSPAGQELAAVTFELCVRDPVYDEDIVVATDSRTLTLVHLGRRDIAEAERAFTWRVEGTPALVRALPKWGGIYSAFANVRSNTSDPIRLEG